MKFFAKFHEHQFVSILGLIQFGLILGGWMGTAAHLKLMGYPESMNFWWNPQAVFVRHWGFLLVLIPFGWMGLVLHLRTRPDSNIADGWLIGSGILLALVLLLVLSGTAIDAGFRRGPIQGLP